MLSQPGRQAGQPYIDNINAARTCILQKSEDRRIDITKKALFSLFVKLLVDELSIDRTRISGNGDWEKILVAFNKTVE